MSEHDSLCDDFGPGGGCTLCATASSVSVDAAYAFGDWPPGHAEAYREELSLVTGA